MRNELKSALEKAIELAKEGFGVRIIARKGFDIGNLYDGFDNNCLTIDEIQQDYNLTEDDIKSVLDLKEGEIFHCSDGYYIIQPCYTIVNKGWREELAELVRSHPDIIL